MLSRSGFRGVIHMLATSKGGLPEVEFLGGEGPGQIMDQIQGFAVPWIKKAVDPAGPSLLWEEFDPEAGELRRRRTLVESRLEFEVCRDEQGLELLLPSEAGASRAWLPLGPLAEPGRRQRSALGWRVEEPSFLWRYVGIGSAPTIEITWRCGSIYRSWAEELERRFPVLKCRLGAKSVCQLSRVADRALAYRGHYPLPRDCWLPARWRLGLDLPLVVSTEDGAARRALDDEVPVTVDALDFRAVLGGRTTRLVSLDDLAERFVAEVLTAEEALLPDEIPAGMVSGLPWTVVVERHAPEAPVRAGDCRGGVRVHPASTRHRRWTLRPRDSDGYWGQVDWRDYPPRLAFGLGSADPERAPEIARIPERRATVGWRVDASDVEDELLCFTVPYWIPMGELGMVAALPCSSPPGGYRRDDGSNYASEVIARIEGLEERFSIDPGSEVPRNRVFLDPRYWRFYDESTGDLQDAEALGEVDGYVRWLRPSSGTNGDGLRGGREVSPTDWAAGSAPVLLVRRPAGDEEHRDVVDWGGLWVPKAVPWQALEEVRPERTGFDLVLTPRASLPAVWISLWGFLCRYDRHPMIFSQTRREPQEIVAWIARTGLELFPRRGANRDSGAGRAFLMRSFAPLYAVRDSDPRIFALEPGGPRPVLRLGRELGGAELTSIRIGEETFLRYQVAPPERPPDFFSTGRIPGRALLLPLDDDRDVVWLAVRQQREKATRPAPRGDGGELCSPEAGYLISWDAVLGWRFRGYFAEHEAAVELGKVRLGDQTARVFLGDDARVGRRAFRLTIDGEGHAWSETTPEDVAGRVTAEMIAEWERHYYARDRLPPPLGGHELRILRQASGDGPWIFELRERDRAFQPDSPPGIRVWEPQEGAAEEHLAGVRVLGEEEPQARAAGGLPGGEAAQTEPARRLLAADEDEDDDF